MPVIMEEISRIEYSVNPAPIAMSIARRKPVRHRLSDEYSPVLVSDAPK